jgi:hypothetical protein
VRGRDCGGRHFAQIKSRGGRGKPGIFRHLIITTTSLRQSK